MARRPIALVVALVALVSSLTAMLLIWLKNPGRDSWVPNLIERVLEGLLLYGALGLVVASSVVLVALALAGTPDRPSRRRIELKPQENVVYRVDPAVQYRTAVEMAWTDKKLNKVEKERLDQLEVSLNLSRDQAAGIEHQFMGRAKEEVETHEDEPKEKIVYLADPAAAYRAAVEMAWADGRLNQAEENQLGALELDLKMSGGQAEEIERAIMGGTREDVVSSGDDRDEGRRALYHSAVEMAWADEKLNGDERDRLSALENELGLSSNQAADIERKVMGGTKEEIELDGVESSDGAWTKLVEECVGLVDELDRHMASFDPQHQELADHVILRLEEVLERSGVDVISDEVAFDSRRHRPETAGSRTSPGATITETLSPGFAVGRRVLRRARVRVE